MVPLHNRPNCLSTAEYLISKLMRFKHGCEPTDSKVAETDRNLDRCDEKIVYNLYGQCGLNECSHLGDVQDLSAIAHSILSHDPDFDHVCDSKQLHLVSFLLPEMTRDAYQSNEHEDIILAKISQNPCTNIGTKTNNEY